MRHKKKCAGSDEINATVAKKKGMNSGGVRQSEGDS